MLFSCPAQFNQENSNSNWHYFKGGLHVKRVFRQRVDAVAERISGLFGLPDIIALQEVENINVLNQISNQIHARRFTCKPASVRLACLC